MLLIGTAASSDGPLEFEAILCWCLVCFFCISLGSTPQPFRLNWILFYMRRNGNATIAVETDRGVAGATQLGEDVSLLVALVGQSGGEGNPDTSHPQQQRHKRSMVEKTKRVIHFIRYRKKPTMVHNNCAQTIVLRVRDRVSCGKKILTLWAGEDGRMPVNCLQGTYMTIDVFVQRMDGTEEKTGLYFDTDVLEAYLDLFITGQGTKLQLEKGRQRPGYS